MATLPQRLYKSLKTRVAQAWGGDKADEVDRSGFAGAEAITQASLLGNGVVNARSRQDIYAQYQQMLADPVVSGALRIHVTAALGGHETSGDMVFIEPTAAAREAAGQEANMVTEMAADLGPIFNRIAMQVAFNGVSFGDAYGRIYPVKGRGIVDVAVDEMMLPPLVQPYEIGNKTVVCLIGVGAKGRERLVMNQIARLKMPRMIYTPQPLAVEKAWRTRIKEDDPDQLPAMPSLVGGSFLADSESQYANWIAALNGLVGQRVLDSIDESIVTVQTQGMTLEQRQQFTASIAKIFKRSKEVADEAIMAGRPLLRKIRHILPVWFEKQIVSLQGINSGGATGGGRAGNISIEDVMFHAKLLSGSLGIDISMLGFADIMSGGLGDGGFIRTSVQAAERSRALRVAMAEFFNHIADVHVQYRYGRSYEGAERPWQVNFYGTISAMEAERQKTSAEAGNTALIVLQVLTMARDAGLDEKALAHLLERVAKMDKTDAEMYAKSVVAAKKEADAANAPPRGFGA